MGRASLSGSRLSLASADAAQARNPSSGRRGTLRLKARGHSAKHYGFCHSGMVRRTGPQTCNYTSGNLKLPVRRPGRLAPPESAFHALTELRATPLVSSSAKAEKRMIQQSEAPVIEK